MCVAAIAWDAHPRWRLVAIGNRDEFHDRPTAPLDKWADAGGIIAGRDLRSGGTWLGVSDTGFALVTNVRGYGGPDPQKASRGVLVGDLLTGTGRYADPQTATLDAFNPFNLIHADASGARLLSNRPQIVRTRLASGIYGLSNGTLDEPWPKTLALKAALLDWLTGTGHDRESLFAILASQALPAYGVAPLEASEVPVEPRDTPPFIRNPVYGTRCSTLVTITAQGLGTITERRFTPTGEPAGETTLEFAWEVETG